MSRGGAAILVVTCSAADQKFVPFLYRRPGKVAFLAHAARMEPITYVESMG
jgi:hypothetical protein